MDRARDAHDVSQWRSAALTSCTGNCNQGRMCDCVPDVEVQPPPEHAVRFVGALLFACSALVLLGLYLWVRG